MLTEIISIEQRTPKVATKRERLFVLTWYNYFASQKQKLEGTWIRSSFTFLFGGNLNMVEATPGQNYGSAEGRSPSYFCMHALGNRGISDVRNESSDRTFSVLGQDVNFADFSTVVERGTRPPPPPTRSHLDEGLVDCALPVFADLCVSSHPK